MRYMCPDISSRFDDRIFSKPDLQSTPFDESMLNDLDDIIENEKKFTINQSRKKKEPTNQKNLNPRPYLPLIPFDMQEIVNECGTVGLYFSIPILYFAKIISMGLQKDYAMDHSQIEYYDERWSKEYNPSSDSMILFIHMIYSNEYVFLTICSSAEYPEGCILLVSAHDEMTVVIEQYIQSTYEFALRKLAQNSNLSNIIPKKEEFPPIENIQHFHTPRMQIIPVESDILPVPASSEKKSWWQKLWKK